MLFRELALKNVKKNAKEYLIYFITLMFSVNLFYTFNSIGAQLKMFSIEDSMNFFAFAQVMIIIVSIFICIVIGALVVYANRFLLRKRKKEIGIYITLGMEQKDLKGLMMWEMIIIGFVSWIAGIATAIFTSQGLSFLTAKMTDSDISNIKFLISFSSIIKSLIFFCILFIVVHYYNTKEIKKLKLIELLNADKKNEVWNMNLSKDILLFAASLLLIAFGYWWFIAKLSRSINWALFMGVTFLSIGTILFFLSISSIVFSVLSRNKKFYYSGLNMFVLQQLMSKIKSSGISMAIISVLIFSSISTMAIGIGTGKSQIKDVYNASPYDVSFVQNLKGDSDYNDSKAVLSLKELEKNGIYANELFRDYALIKLYNFDNIIGGNFLSDGIRNKTFDPEEKVTIIGIDDYNNALRLQGKSPISLNKDEYAINFDVKGVKNVYEKFLKGENTSIEINGIRLSPAENALNTNTYLTEMMLMDRGTIIVPQKILSGLEPSQIIINCNFKDESGYKRFLEVYMPSDVFTWSAKQDVTEQSVSDTIVTSYLGIYLGIIFLVTAGAVLALQQLSQSADNINRYKLLRKLGAREKELHDSIVKQLFIYFGIPFILALIHALVVITGIYVQLTNVSIIDFIGNVILSVGITSIVYSVYYSITYLGSKNMLEDY